MTLQVFADLPQRSDEWYEARRGIVTASAVQKLITTRKLSAIDYPCPACEATAGSACISSKAGVGEMKSLHKERTAHSSANKSATTIFETASNDESRGLTAQLVAERISGFIDPTFTTADMWRGIDDEPRARDAYAAHMGVRVDEVGFITEDRWGFKIGLSPDGLVGNDGGIEIKSRRPKGHVQTVIADTVPFYNVAQIQTSLLVTGRAWWDYVSYAGGMALYVKRVYPDPMWQKAIVNAVRAFEANAQEMVRLYGETVAGMPMTERTPDFNQVELKLA